MQKTELYSTARGYDLGHAVYFTWNVLDEVIIPSWSRHYFGDKTNVSSESSRCEDDFHIELGNLSEQNHADVRKLYELYDLEGYYDLDDEWNDYNIGKPISFELPQSISVRIISDYLQKEIGFRIAAAVAVYNGVYFYENEIVAANRSISISVATKKLVRSDPFHDVGGGHLIWE